jgi:hypothetical protein
VARIRVTIGVPVALLLGGSLALAATGRITLRHTRTFSVARGSTRTLRVGYPDALRYGRSRYSGKVRVLQEPPGNHGGGPSPSDVHVLSRGSCEGGSDFCVRVRNSSASRDPAQIRVTAQTELPPGKRR